MKPTSELAERALDLAREVAEGAYGPNVRAQVESSSDGWHGTIHRHLFEQQMSLWTSFSYLDVISDGAGHIVGFVDHEAYRRADDTSVLSEDDVRAVVADDEFLPPGACIIDRMTYSGPEGGRLEAVTVEGHALGKLRRWLVEINIARRLVASVRPLDETDGAG